MTSRTRFFYKSKPCRVEYQSTDSATVYFDNQKLPIRSCPLQLRQTAIRAILKADGKLSGAAKHQYIVSQHTQKLKAKWKK